jgi:prophage maintenance system killer protein
MKKKPKNESAGPVELFKSDDGTVHLEVRLERDSVWLTQAQIAQLFARERSVITKHLRNVFRTGELAEKSNVQQMHIPSSKKPVTSYSLDAVLSVGYRVNSKRGTQFRIWATRMLKDHLVRGYTLNEQRLRERSVREIEQAVARLDVTKEGQADFDVVQNYANAWRLLLAFDEDRLANEPAAPRAPRSALSLIEARGVIGNLRRSLAGRQQATELFGRERGEQLAAILGAIEQTSDGKALYPTAQARAAHLLYSVIKDRPFADGNKRIGALLFLEYLQGNGLLLREDGSVRFAANAVVALALLIAESEPSAKGLMIRLILGLLDD